MEIILKQFKQLAEDCVELSKVIKLPQGHVTMCNGITVYLSSNGDYSVYFNKLGYSKSVEYTMYSGKINFGIDFTEVDLQEVLSLHQTIFLEFKASDLSEVIKNNLATNNNRITELKKELERLENS